MELSLQHMADGSFHYLAALKDLATSRCALGPSSPFLKVCRLLRALGAMVTHMEFCVTGLNPHLPLQLSLLLTE